MADTFVQSTQVVGSNGSFYFTYNYVTGVVGGFTKQFNTTNMQIIGPVWLKPRVVGSRVQTCEIQGAVNSSTPPTTDSVKALELKDVSDNSGYYIAIALTDEGGGTSSPPGIYSMFAYLTDGSGGTLPSMPVVTMPFPVIEHKPVAITNGSNVFHFAFPPNALGLEYSIPAPTFNGVAPGTAYAPSGITTPAEFVTWASSNWDAQGTWSSSGNIVSLASTITPDAWVSGTSYVPGNLVTNAGHTYVNILAVSGSTVPGSDGTHWTDLGATIATASTAGMIVELAPAAYCLDLTSLSGSSVNQVKFGSGALIPITPFVLDATNNQPALIRALQQVITDPNLTFGYATAHKLTVNTVYDTPKLYFSGASVVDASSGACS